MSLPIATYAFLGRTCELEEFGALLASQAPWNGHSHSDGNSRAQQLRRHHRAKGQAGGA